MWYAKDKERIKYRPLFAPKKASERGDEAYKYIELADGIRRTLSAEEREGKLPLPHSAKIYTIGDLQSQGVAKIDTPFSFEGKIYRPNRNNHWKAQYPNGMQRLNKAERIQAVGQNLRFLRFVEDFPVMPLTNAWIDTGFAGFATDKRYVVETNPKVVERCILMSTDAGDLVLIRPAVRGRRRMRRRSGVGGGLPVTRAE
ncbi:MAG: hypothetical protein RMK98_05535 [Bacteroidia bacterium]|nr:hypothetical protein [Bacteroidia bacterium]